MANQIATRQWINENILPGAFSENLTKTVLYEEVSGNTGLTVSSINSATNLEYVSNQAVLCDDFSVVEEFKVECGIENNTNSGYTGTSLYGFPMFESSSGVTDASSFTFTMKNSHLAEINVSQSTIPTNDPSATPAPATCTLTYSTGGTETNPEVVFTYQPNIFTDTSIIYLIEFVGETLKGNTIRRSVEIRQDDDQSIFYFTNSSISTSTLSNEGGTISQFGLNYGKKNQIHWEGFDRSTIFPVTGGTGNVSEYINWSVFNPSTDLVLQEYPNESWITFNYLPNQTASERDVKLVITGSTLAGRTVYCYPTSSMTGNAYVTGRQAAATPQLSITRIDGGGNISSTGGTAEFRIDKLYVSGQVNVSTVPSEGVVVTMVDETGATVTFPQNSVITNKTYRIIAAEQSTSLSAETTVVQNAVPYIALSPDSRRVEPGETTSSTNFTTNCSSIATATCVNVETANVSSNKISATFPANGKFVLQRYVTVSGTSEGVSTSATFRIEHVGYGITLTPQQSNILSTDNSVVFDIQYDIAFEDIEQWIVVTAKINQSILQLPYSFDSGHTQLTLSLPEKQEDDYNEDTIKAKIKVVTSDNSVSESYESTCNRNAKGRLYFINETSTASATEIYNTQSFVTNCTGVRIYSTSNVNSASIGSRNTVIITFSKNYDTTSTIERSVTISGTTPDGGIIYATHTIIQEKGYATGFQFEYTGGTLGSDSGSTGDFAVLLTNATLKDIVPAAGYSDDFTIVTGGTSSSPTITFNYGKNEGSAQRTFGFSPTATDVYGRTLRPTPDVIEIVQDAQTL